MNKKKSVKTQKTIKQSSGERVCLLGFMGAGKTTTAKILAEKTGNDWLDLDEFIEAREKRKIAQIIENLGEKIFREIESDALREIFRADGKQIIALGGGTWLINENRRLIKEQKCRTVWLDVPFEMCWERIADLTQKRPLAVTLDSARELYDARRSVYETADVRVTLTPEKSSADLAAEIFDLMNGEKPVAKSSNKKNAKKSVDKTATSG